MKKQVLTFAALLVFTAGCYGSDGAKATLPNDFKQQPAGISFTENKGQVHDQDYKPRPDVLYSVQAGNMVVHIKNNGLNYQLYHVDKYKKAITKELPFALAQPVKQQIEQESIQRIDLNWLNYNTNFTETQDEVLPGYNNYYTVNCPEGALYVKSYKGVTLHDLYKGINLHYYEKNGDLKHDYIVAPHADYKQIQIKVTGADITINEDGSLLLTTPLGKIQEGAPVVYQKGGLLKAKWKIVDNVLGFEIENYDPGQQLIIDPVTRAWGTYYGGAGEDFFAGMSTDASGNVYLAGSTTTSISINIATSGAQQSVYGGGMEALLVKFSAGGVRQWGTYYGGIVDERGTACYFDASGFVYFTGSTTSGAYLTSSSGVIATSGAYETQSWGNMDAFLVKFNTNGVRQWGTFYSGPDDEAGSAVTTDNSGNVYMAGYTHSSINMATTGAHQTVYGGGALFDYDAFLVKFNSSGQRLWGTYYGGFGNDNPYGCVTDASGNVYMAGQTVGSLGTVIATPAAHQPAFGGGNSDGFLVKFDASGVRQWGTYYGGSSNDAVNACAIDASNNIYLSGGTNSTGTNIATPGAHQPLSGGGSEAFLVKFNANGQRQWGTFYGGPQNESGNGCAVDPNGNVFLSGTASTGSGTIIATLGSYQPTYSGGGNGIAYLAKFDASGQRQWATYYGTTVSSVGSTCATDLFSNVFMAGFMAPGAGSTFASPSCYQASFGGGNSDGYVVKFDDCTVAPGQPSAIAGATTACFGVAETYTTPFVPGANSYTLFVPGGNPGSNTSNSFSVIPVTSGLFTLVASNGCGASPQQTLNVTVNPTPTVTLNSGTICAGESFMLIGGGADTYIYSSGPLVAPAFTTTYVVVGTTSLGCSSSANSTVYVNPIPNVIVNSGAICQGQSFTISASGASTYSYSAGPVVSPTITTSYVITGTNSFGCSGTALCNVTVESYPTISVNSGAICLGSSFVLSASGAYSYTYSGGTTVSPVVTTTYSVIGKSQAGCAGTNTAIATVTVNPLPNIIVSTSNAMACAGDELILTASGANTYTFDPIGPGTSVTITPTVTSTYTVTGMDANGCVNVATFTQDVDACTGIKENALSGSGIKIYPNPTKGIVNLEVNSDCEIIVMNAMGQIVYSSKLSSGNHQINLENLAVGIYVVRLGNTVNSENIKMIKE